MFVRISLRVLRTSSIILSCLNKRVLSWPQIYGPFFFRFAVKPFTILHLVLYFTSTSINHKVFFLQNTSCIRKPGGGGGGLAHSPLSLDPLLHQSPAYTFRYCRLPDQRKMIMAELAKGFLKKKIDTWNIYKRRSMSWSISTHQERISDTQREYSSNHLNISLLNVF